MKTKMAYLMSFLVVGLTFIMLTGCFTQIRTVSKTSVTDYDNPKDEPVYETEYRSEADNTDSSNNSPIYQYNFYGWEPHHFDFYYPPFYNGFNISFGYYDPLFYDPFIWEPWYVYNWHAWQPYYYWGVHRDYFYGSPYYAPYYNPYWDYADYPYERYNYFKPQQRRDFEPRRGLGPAEANDSQTPYIPAVAAGGKNVSRIERINKERTTTATPILDSGNDSIERTRKNAGSESSVMSTTPIRRVSTESRHEQPATIQRTKPTSEVEAGQTRSYGERRKASDNSNKQSTTTGSRTPKSNTPTVRRTTPTRSSTPATNKSSGSKGSGDRSYKPRSSSPAPAATPPSSGSSRSSNGSGSGSKGSSSRTKKDK